MEEFSEKEVSSSTFILYALLIAVLLFLISLILVIPMIVVSIFGQVKILVYFSIALMSVIFGVLVFIIINKLTKSEVRYFISAAMIPLPASILLYGFVRYFFYQLAYVMKNVEITPSLTPSFQQATVVTIFQVDFANIPSAIITASLFYVFFNIPFVYNYFSRMKKNHSLLFTYVVGIITLVLCFLIIELLLQRFMV